MAVQYGHDDLEGEEDMLLAGEQMQPLVRRHGLLRIAVSATLLLAVGSATLRSAYSKNGGHSALPLAPNSVIEGKAEVLHEQAPHEPALHPDRAVEKNTEREVLTVEKDLAALFGQIQGSLALPGGDGGQGDEDACHELALSLFDSVASTLGLKNELDKQEIGAYKHRFAVAMRAGCKGTGSENIWFEAAAEQLEQQKPVMTKALAASLNGAKLGFRVQMRRELIDETKEKFQKRLGYLPVPNDQNDVLQRGRTGSVDAGDLPKSFRADSKWPMCAEAILRIHNQGHCGSCWAFGGLAAADARMCVASNGTWNTDEDILSRLEATSCAGLVHYPEGYDGCQGGFPHWPYEWMAQSGLSSSACVPYYITGEGTEHFEQRDTAPPCMDHCQGGYETSMAEDKFWAAGISNYDWLVHVHGDEVKIAMTKRAIYEEGPVSFAFQANGAFMGYTSGVFSVCTGNESANHAVYAYGWGEEEGVEFMEASNSWGTDWGANGHFRIHPRCVTDVTIAGSITGNPINHTVGEVNTSVPRDADNEDWPWLPMDECPFVDGCVTDIEQDGDYVPGENCRSKALNGKMIRVVVFEMEAGYDFLLVNGYHYSGEGWGLNGTVVNDDGIMFKADFSIEGAGFKICAEENATASNGTAIV